MNNETALYDACKRLLDCVTAQLGAATPERSCVTVGTPVPWDNCCPGQLTVSAESGYSSKNFPAPDSGVWPCSPTELGAVLLVQLLRCMPSSDDNGNPPTIASLDEAAQDLYLDAMRIRHGIRCCFGDLDALVEPFTFPADGGCVAVEARVTVDLFDPCGC